MIRSQEGKLQLIRRIVLEIIRNIPFNLLVYFTQNFLRVFLIRKGNFPRWIYIQSSEEIHLEQVSKNMYSFRRAFKRVRVFSYITYQIFISNSSPSIFDLQKANNQAIY